MIIAMGAADHLVAVSNFDLPRDGTRDLPRVGDYQTTDWERLGALRPAAMITQFAPDRLPAGLKQRADSLGIRLVNVHIDRLDDIYVTLQALGDTIGRPDLGQAATAGLRSKLDQIAQRHRGGKPVRALIVLDDSARGVVGRNNYLDDILTVAGGENVMRTSSMSYPSIDREVLLDLDPDVIFQLLPGASPQVRAAAGRMWQSMPQLKAVRNGRVHIATQWWAELPTQHVAELAEFFAAALNEARGGETSQPSTAPLPTPAQRAGSSTTTTSPSP